MHFFSLSKHDKPLKTPCGSERCPGGGGRSSAAHTRASGSARSANSRDMLEHPRHRELRARKASTPIPLDQSSGVRRKFRNSTHILTTRDFKRCRPLASFLVSTNPLNPKCRLQLESLVDVLGIVQPSAESMTLYCRERRILGLFTPFAPCLSSIRSTARARQRSSLLKSGN